MSAILILTHARDDCADMVIKHLERKSVDFIRFNTEEFQKSVKFTVDLSSSGEVSGHYRFPDRDLHFEEIGVVWNRRIHEPTISDELDNEPDLKQWMLDECIWGLNNSFTLIAAPFVNPWEENERLKFNKWVQMKRAAELGFKVPLSRMTNDLNAIGKFWEYTEHEMCFKKIRKGIFNMNDGRTLIVHTSKIPPEKMTEQGIQRMRFCPMFFQAYIPKKYDIRSVVVGNEVFSVAIHSQGVPEGVVDYRTAAVLGKLHEMKHEIVDLGETVNRRLVEYTKSFGLSFGAIDLIETLDDHLVFLEDNPNGQWGWLEQKTGIPISSSFAEYLSEFLEM